MADSPDLAQGYGAWERLRRRKVVQWGLLYAAGAWGFLQGLEYVTETFHWPEQVRQIALLSALIGLPLVLIIAWYHGDRGEQHVRGAELALIALLFLVGGGIFWLYDRASDKAAVTATESETSKARASIADARPSIAVLPFENRSRAADDAFFVDGIHDDILTQLSKVSALRVISRTSVEQFRNTRLPVKEIARQLGVTSILEGGVQRGGERIRVYVQLIDATTDAHLWAESYDRELTAANIFGIQSEVAAAIADALRAALTPDERTRVDAVPTQNVAAWEAFQLGKQRMASRTSASVVAAETFFRKALEIDPGLALAYAGLADALVAQTGYGDAPILATLKKAEEAIATALRLDPKLGEAWASAGLVAQSRQQFDRAEQDYRRAIELNPNYAPAHYWLSQVLRIGGRLNESVVQAERAVALDPLSARTNEDLGEALNAIGRWSDAEARLRRAIEIDPTRPRPYSLLGEIKAYSQNNFVDAVLLMRRAVDLDAGDPTRIADLAWLYVDLVDDAAANQLLSAALERWPDDLRVRAISMGMKLRQFGLDAASHDALTILKVDPRSGGALWTLTLADWAKGDHAAARTRYANAYPELLGSSPPRIDGSNYGVAIDLASILQKTGESERAQALLDLSEEVVRKLTRLSRAYGYGVSDVQIHALRGDRAKALAALREAEAAGWRVLWCYYRDFDPALASIRNEPEFKAIFADIERDMARQRAALAARPKAAPLDLAGTGT